MAADKKKSQLIFDLGSIKLGRAAARLGKLPARDFPSESEQHSTMPAAETDRPTRRADGQRSFLPSASSTEGRKKDGATTLFRDQIRRCERGKRIGENFPRDPDDRCSHSSRCFFFCTRNKAEKRRSNKIRPVKQSIEAPG